MAGSLINSRFLLTSKWDALSLRSLLPAVGERLTGVRTPFEDDMCDTLWLFAEKGDEEEDTVDEDTELAKGLPEPGLLQKDKFITPTPVPAVISLLNRLECSGDEYLLFGLLLLLILVDIGDSEEVWMEEETEPDWVDG